MLDNKGFDLWADHYDESVRESDEDNRYPFAGYREILNRIYQRVLEKDGAAVLDIGFGTAFLTSRLYEKGCDIWGQDFSEKMLQLAQDQMPMAHLYQGDFSKGLAEPLLQHTYDFIIATYSLHHLSQVEKVELIQSLRGLLSGQGEILIGDVAFPTYEDLEKCRVESGDEWDPDEIYFVYEEMKKEFPGIRFEKFSYCAGILTVTR